jgi:hypothetical protein
MGQGNNSKRNATLDEHKVRAAGRQQNKPEVEAIRTRGAERDRKAAGGAFGRGAKADRRSAGVGRSSRRTRKSS